MTRARHFTALAAMLVLFFQARAECDTLAPPAAREAACEHFFREMDRLVAENNAADAGAARIAGFPELRVDRFLASFADAHLVGEAYAAWVERLRKLDETARLIEWRNLPPEAAARLQAPFGLEAGKAVTACGHTLAERALNSPVRRFHLLAGIEPPDVYSTWQRAAGLYVLSRWAVVGGVRRVHREMREPFIEARGDSSFTGQLLHYAPPGTESSGTAGIPDLAATNPLGIPEPSEDRLARLFAAFAPVWAVDTVDDSDRIGAVRLDADGNAWIDTKTPAVYRLASHTRVGGQVLLQLNYIVWFPSRPPACPMDIYAGRFDGIIWRVTLRSDGRPLAYDSIHPCGCYYLIFPGEGMRVVQPLDGSEPVVSPMPAPRLGPGERLVVRIASRTHFIRGVATQEAMPEAAVYGWLDYDELRSLPLSGSRHRSLFASDGLVPGSERLERFLFWPMGVPSAGAMRQWGTHAIAFLGKRYFDDPRLLEELLRPLRE